MFKNLCYYSNFLRRDEDRAYREIRSSILGEKSENTMNGIIYPFMYLTSQATVPRSGSAIPNGRKN